MAEELTELSEVERELVVTLVERLNHIEGVLTGSLLGFLVTTTLSIGGGLYVLTHDEDKSPISSSVVMNSVAVVYALLSGYYYFFLAHFYAAAVSLVPLAERVESVDLENFWTVFQAPVPGPGGFRNFFGLLSAPLYPLLFSWTAILGIHHYLRKSESGNAKGKTSRQLLFRALGIQTAVMMWVILLPFIQFIRTIDLWK